MPTAAIIKKLYDSVLERAIVNTVFNIHKTLNVEVSISISEESEDSNVQDNAFHKNFDVFGFESSTSKRQIECICFKCHRNIAALRFAPHLEKCIGIGRNSRAATRHVTTHFGDSSTPVKRRSSMRVASKNLLLGIGSTTRTYQRTKK